MRSKVFFAALVIVPFAVGACDLIIGLNKYCNDDCDASAVDASDASTDSPADAIADVLEIPDVVDEATSWPLWRIENPIFEVEAGAASSSLQNFQSVGDGGTVLDTITNLTWSLSVKQTDTIELGAAYCASLQPSGFRLPTRIELVTLLDTTQTKNPFIATPFVQAITNASLASATLRTSSYARPITQPIQYWFVSMQNGGVATTSDGPEGTLCVR